MNMANLRVPEYHTSHRDNFLLELFRDLSNTSLRVKIVRIQGEIAHGKKGRRSPEEMLINNINQRFVFYDLV